MHPFMDFRAANADTESVDTEVIELPDEEAENMNNKEGEWPDGLCVHPPTFHTSVVLQSTEALRQ